jgi:hypothetical protein
MFYHELGCTKLVQVVVRMFVRIYPDLCEQTQKDTENGESLLRVRND